MPGLIAIVGRPNVGKSALFNRMVGRRIAIVHDEPGVTRDRVSAEAEWRGRPFTLVDTGGIGLLRREKTADPIAQAAFTQVQLAIESAQVILLVTNVQEGITPLDHEVAARLRQSGKPVLVAVNKVDNAQAESAMGEFAELGFEAIFPVSAIHGRGLEPLLQAAVTRLPLGQADPPPSHGESATPQAEPAGLSSPVKLAMVGRPNVGKSSIINALTRSERVVVSPIPGTTRDAIDVPFEVETEGERQQYILIDTAGIRKPRRIEDSIEFFSVKRAEHSIARCDIAILVLDAQAGITEQDKKVADKIVAEHKACIMVVNKWDLYEAAVRQARESSPPQPGRKADDRGVSKPLTTLAEFGQWVQAQMFFLDYAPVIFTSACSGFNLDRLLEAIRYVTAELRQTIPTALLNRVLHEAIEKRQPISATGHFLKFFYATQVRQVPPTFLLFVNRDELFSESYGKYLAREMRRTFGYEGCPILLIPKPRPKTIEAKRQPKGRNRPQPRRQRFAPRRPA